MFMWKQRPGGSSPLARGTLVLTFTVEDCERLIPARAGNTILPADRAACNPAHPRSRGEHKSFYIHGHKDYGSSPLARGTREPDLSLDFQVRLIPARAGNTHL